MKTTEEITIRFQNRYGGDEIILTTIRGKKYFTLDYGGVRLVLNSTELFDFIEMLKEVYEQVK